jgi:hypothetical protein
MRGYGSRGRFRFDPITDRARPIVGRKPATLTSAMLLAAVVGIALVAYFLDRYFGGGWYAALTATAIVGVLSVNGMLLVG